MNFILILLLFVTVFLQRENRNQIATYTQDQQGNKWLSENLLTEWKSKSKDNKSLFPSSTLSPRKPNSFVFPQMICSLDKCDRWLGNRIIVLRFCKNYFLSAIFDAKGRKSFQRHNPLKLIGCKNFRDAGFEDGEIPTKKSESWFPFTF